MQFQQKRKCHKSLIQIYKSGIPTMYSLVKHVFSVIGEHCSISDPVVISEAIFNRETWLNSAVKTGQK